MVATIAWRLCWRIRAAGFFQPAVGPRYRGFRLHHVLGGRVSIAVQGGLAEPAQQRAVSGQDEREPIGGAGDSLTHGADWFVQLGGDHITASRSLARGTIGVFAFVGQPVGEPVGLAQHVEVDVGEAEGLEPARGSGARVSEAIQAVDDDRPAVVELAGGGRVRIPASGDRAGRWPRRGGQRGSTSTSWAPPATSSPQTVQVDPGRHRRSPSSVEAAAVADQSSWPASALTTSRLIRVSLLTSFPAELGPPGRGSGCGDLGEGDGSGGEPCWAAPDRGGVEVLKKVTENGHQSSTTDTHGPWARKTTTWLGGTRVCPGGRRIGSGLGCGGCWSGPRPLAPSAARIPHHVIGAPRPAQRALNGRLVGGGFRPRSPRLPVASRLGCGGFGRPGPADRAPARPLRHRGPGRPPGRWMGDPQAASYSASRRRNAAASSGPSASSRAPNSTATVMLALTPGGWRLRRCWICRACWRVRGDDPACPVPPPRRPGPHQSRHQVLPRPQGPNRLRILGHVAGRAGAVGRGVQPPAWRRTQPKVSPTTWPASRWCG